MVSFQSAIFAALSWSVTPIVAMDNNWPIRCGIHYYDEKKNISFKVEKFVRETKSFDINDSRSSRPAYFLSKSKNTNN